MGKYKSLGYNSLYTFIGTIGSKTISFIMLPFYTKWLSVEDYGTSDIMNVYSTLIMSIVTLSMHEAIFVFPARQTILKQKEYFSTAIFSSVISILIVFVFFGVLELIPQHILPKNSFSDNKWFIAILFSTTYLQYYTQQFCRGINKMNVFCYSGIIVTLFTALFSFVFIPRYGLYGYVLAYALSNLAGTLYTMLALRIKKYFTLSSIKWAAWKEMINYAIPLIPNATLWWITSALNRPFMEVSLGVSAIGLFAVANKFPQLVSVVFTIFNNSWQVSVLQEYGKNHFDDFLYQVSKMYIPLLIILSSLLALVNKYLFILFIDEKYFEAWPYSLIISFSVIALGAGGVYGSIFSAIKKSKYYLYSTVIGAITSVILNALLISSLGILGAALSFVVSHFVLCILRIYFASQYVKLKGMILFSMFLLMNIIIVIGVLFEYEIYSWCVLLAMLCMYVYINRENLAKMKVAVVQKYRHLVKPFLIS